MGRSSVIYVTEETGVGALGSCQSGRCKQEGVLEKVLPLGEIVRGSSELT